MSKDQRRAARYELARPYQQQSSLAHLRHKQLQQQHNGLKLRQADSELRVYRREQHEQRYAQKEGMQQHQQEETRKAVVPVSLGYSQECQRSHFSISDPERKSFLPVEERKPCKTYGVESSTCPSCSRQDRQVPSICTIRSVNSLKCQRVIQQSVIELKQSEQEQRESERVEVEGPETVDSEERERATWRQLISRRAEREFERV